jgi:serine/threonine-protein kinase
MPHDAAERVCPNTGLALVQPAPAQRPDMRRSKMSERPPVEPGESFVYDPVRSPARAPSDRPPKSRQDSAPVSRKREGKHDLTGQTIGARYRIRGVLGEGGMGTVYDAEHLGLARHVAIKVLSPAHAKKRVSVKRFQQEARAAGAIGHPNICEVYDLGLLEDGSPYLVMEKLVGYTLSDRIAKEGGLPFDDVVEVIAQVLSGLIAAHEKGIVHRDIKPENIFLASRLGSPPIIKLLDFGVSKMMPEFQTHEDFDLTRTGMVMGTPYYMSPEQARGERNLDGRVDVYACGVVMYEAIAGKRPFMAPNYNALLLSIINTSPKPLRDVRPSIPAELEAIISRAMSRNRDDRFPSAKHFLRELAPPVPSAEGSGSRLPPSGPVEERGRPTSPGVRSRRDGPSVRIVPDASARIDPAIAFEPTMRRAPKWEAPTAAPRSRPSTPQVVDEESDSIDIPIEVTPPEDEIRDETLNEIEDEPTEIHTRPAMTGSRSAARIPPPTQPIEDWDGATLVKRPPDFPAPPPSVPADRPSRRGRGPRPFNPDETIKLDSKSDVELIDNDPRLPPRRR